MTIQIQDPFEPHYTLQIKTKINIWKWLAHEHRGWNRNDSLHVKKNGHDDNDTKKNTVMFCAIHSHSVKLNM